MYFYHYNHNFHMILFRFYFINSILMLLHLNDIKIDINTKKLDECVFPIILPHFDLIK